MNFEETRTTGYEEPVKAGRSWFACCGIGCLILVLICGAGTAISYFVFRDDINTAFDQMKLHAETMQLAMESNAVQEKLGEPVTIQGFAWPNPTQEGDKTRISYKLDLSGPKGKGELFVDYLIEPGAGVSRTKFEVVIDGETIDLLSSDEFQMPDIEDGMNGEVDDDEADEEIILENEEVPAGAASDG